MEEFLTETMLEESLTSNDCVIYRAAFEAEENIEQYAFCKLLNEESFIGYIPEEFAKGQSAKAE